MNGADLSLLALSPTNGNFYHTISHAQKGTLDLGPTPVQVLWVGNLKTPFEDYASIKYINLDTAEPSTAGNRAITVRLTKEPHIEAQQTSFWFSLGECGIKAGISISRKKSLTK